MDKNMDVNKKYDNSKNISNEEMIQKIKKEVKKIQPELIETIRELVSIYSIQMEPEENAPFGKGPAEALNKALEISERLGFNTVKTFNNNFSKLKNMAPTDFRKTVKHNF